MSLTYSARLPDGLTLLMITEGISVSWLVRQANQGATLDDSIPWGVCLGSNPAANPYLNPIPDNAADGLQDSVDAATANLSAALTAVSTAQDALATAQGTLAAVTAAFNTAGANLNAATMAVSEANSTFDVLQAQFIEGTFGVTQDQLNAAEAAMANAGTILATATLAFPAAQFAYDQAVGTGDISSLGGQVDAVINCQNLLTLALYEQTIGLQNIANYNAVKGEGSESDPVLYESLFFSSHAPSVVGAEGVNVAANDFYHTLTYDSYSCIIGATYDTIVTSGQYAAQVRITGAAAALLSAIGWSIQLNWTEIATLVDTFTDMVTVPPVSVPSQHQCPDYSLVVPMDITAATRYFRLTPQSETLSLADGVAQADGSYIITSSTHSASVPAEGEGSPPDAVTSVEIFVGAAGATACTVGAQYKGAALYRQGFPAFIMTAGESYPVRYLTLTASNGPAAPPLANYSGTLQLSNVPLDSDDDTRTDNFYPSSYETPSRPLLINNNLSSDCDADSLPPTLLLIAGSPPISTAGTIQSATQATLTTPKGMVVSPSAEESPASVVAAVQAVAGDPWLDPDVTPYTSNPSVGFQGALSYASADGNCAMAQAMRYKLTFNVGAFARGTNAATYDVPFRVRQRIRNLDTGAVTFADISRTVTFPVVTDVSGGGTTTSYGLTTDPDWTEIAVPDGNVSIEIDVTPAATGPDPIAIVF